LLSVGAGPHYSNWHVKKEAVVMAVVVAMEVAVEESVALALAQTGQRCQKLLLSAPSLPPALACA
jgi:hypothetical protein